MTAHLAEPSKPFRTLENACIELADERGDAGHRDGEPWVTRLADDEFGRPRLVAAEKGTTQTNCPEWIGYSLADTGIPNIGAKSL